MNKKIDILMATYNGEKYVREQIESILNQTYSEFRLIICDDFSSDNTYNILKEYEIKDERIVLHRNETNLGYIKNFEKLLTLVENDYFMFADQDDVWYETKVEDTFKKIEDTEADLIFTDLEVVDENLNTLNNSYHTLMKYKRKILKADGYNKIYLYNVVTGCTTLTKSKYIKEILPLPNNKNLIHDHYIPLVISLCGGKIEYLDKPTIKYRQHGKNQVGTGRYTDKLKNFEEVRNHLIDIKVSIFTEYVNISGKFEEKINDQNKEALIYFEGLKNIKYINLKGINKYFKLYRYEKVSYKLLYLFVFHFPIICKMGYKIAKVFMKKR